MNEVLTRIENLMELRGMTQKQFCDLILEEDNIKSTHLN